MPIKPSQALLAALAVIAAPAFAQDTTTPAPTETPAAEAPATDAPAADAPATDAPAAATPATDAPAAETPAAETPAAPAGEAPAAGASTETPATPAPATDTPATEGATTTPAPAAPGQAAAPAEPATQETAQLGQYYIKSTETDWTTRCIKTDQAKDPCELYQLMQDSEGNPVAELTLIPLTNGEVAAGATLVAPLETDLIDGLGFAVGSAQPRSYPFAFCAPGGCVSRLGFTEAELAALKRGNEATVSLRPFGAPSDEPIELKMSLSGFTAAFDSLKTYAESTAAPAPAGEGEAAPEAPAE